MTPTAVICWKWQTPGYRSSYGSATVNALRAMVARHYPVPHRFLCVTDDPEGLDPSIEVVPDPKDFIAVPSPHGGKNPSCYRRLRAFAPDAGLLFGATRFVTLDLDCVIVGDLRPLWDRPEDLVLWGDTNPRTHYNGSMILMTAGVRPDVWERFDPMRSPRLARASGCFGSDQGWISYCLGPGEAKWTRADGVYSFRNDIQPVHLARLPLNARMVMFHGAHDPWGPYAQRNCPWVREHYGVCEAVA